MQLDMPARLIESVTATNKEVNFFMLSGDGFINWQQKSLIRGTEIIQELFKFCVQGERAWVLSVPRVKVKAAHATI